MHAELNIYTLTRKCIWSICHLINMSFDEYIYWDYVHMRIYGIIDWYHHIDTSMQYSSRSHAQLNIHTVSVYMLSGSRNSLVTNYFVYACGIQCMQCSCILIVARIHALSFNPIYSIYWNLQCVLSCFWHVTCKCLYILACNAWILIIYCIHTLCVELKYYIFGM